ncbi:MAG: hypothetical protein V4538_09580 [Bacteroidota bacterium]
MALLTLACGKNTPKHTIHQVFKFDTLVVNCQLQAGYDLITQPASAFYNGAVYFSNFTLLNDTGLSVGIYQINNQLPTAISTRYVQLPMQVDNVAFLKENIEQNGNLLLAASSQYIILLIQDVLNVYKQTPNNHYQLLHQIKYKSFTHIGFINDSTFIASRLYNKGTNFIDKGTIKPQGIDFSHSQDFAFDFPNSVKVDYFCQYVDYGNNTLLTGNSYTYKIYLYNQNLDKVDSIYQADFNAGKEEIIQQAEKKYAGNPIAMVMQLDKTLKRITATKMIDENTVFVMYQKDKDKYIDIWQKSENKWQLIISNTKANYMEPMAEEQVFFEPVNFPNTVSNAYNFGFYKNKLVTLCTGGSTNRYTIKKEAINTFFSNQIKNPCLNIDTYTYLKHD